MAGRPAMGAIIINTHAHRELMGAGLGLTTRNADRIDVLASYLSQASCVIVSGFRAALDLDTYPLRNLIRPPCAERAKPGRGKPVLIMHIGFLAQLFSRRISRTQSFQQNRRIAFVAPKLLVSLISRLVAYI